MSTRFFTPATAREALESIRRPAELMSRAYHALELLRSGTIEPERPVDRDYFRLADALVAAMGSLQDSGVVVKDPRAGLVDFPARRAGRTVMLCWKVGEPRVEFWHEEDTGFAGRQPVDEDGPWEVPAGTASGPT